MEAVGIGIVGLGRWARAHAEVAARTDRVEIVSCHSRDPRRRADYAAEFAVPATAGSFEALLADPDVEAVVVATPNDLHVEMGKAALEVGKPALIDKPISVDIAGGLELMRLAPDGGRQIGVAHHARRLAGHRAAKQWLDRGEGGIPRLASADFSNARGAAMSPDAWQTNVKGSEAGVLIQVGIHQLDNLLYLLGPAVAVNARFAHRTLGSTPDAAVAVIQHAPGAISTATSSWTTPSSYRLEVQATGGNLRYRLDHGNWTSPDVDAHGSLVLERDGETDAEVETGAGDPLAEQLDELAAAVRGTGAMEVDVAAGLRAMAVVLASVRSAAGGGAEVTIADLLSEEGATAEEIELLTGAV
jgi:UDP-N-acetyl-2-amino-2-deoxyglucuronate dehydrogenase